MSQSKYDAKSSRKFSYLLRHGAKEEGLHMDEGGWIRVDDILKRPDYQKYTVDQVKELVEKCPKQRFALKEDDEVLYIRATQGHSIEVEESQLLEEITSESKVHSVVHGTFHKHWEAIQEKGLSRMKRQHIHFSPGLPDKDGVISSMRKSCEIYIYIDLPKALAAGFKFFKSSNNVILCPGDKEGFLPPQYFHKVIEKKTGKSLL